MGRMTIAFLCVLLLAAACGESAGESTEAVVATSSTQPSTTTTEATTTSQATTTEVATTTTTPSTDPELVVMLVTWDGTDCVYEGPEAVGNSDVVELNHRNDSTDVSNLGVGSLGGTGPSYEEVTEMLKEDSKISDEPPVGLVPRVALPRPPEVLAAGAEATVLVNFSAACEHMVICFGGDLSCPQNAVLAGSFVVSR